LLWSSYYFGIHASGLADSDGILPGILSHLQTALTIDPNNQKARDLLTEISYSVPEAVLVDGNNFVFLGLTATPPPPTPWLVATETATALPTVTNTPPPTTEFDYIPPPTATPVANPICGSTALTLPVLAGAIWITRRKRS
jgi:hypothetical protein